MLVIPPVGFNTKFDPSRSVHLNTRLWQNEKEGLVAYACCIILILFVHLFHSRALIVNLFQHMMYHSTPLDRLRVDGNIILGVWCLKYYERKKGSPTSLREAQIYKKNIILRWFSSERQVKSEEYFS